jgi:hypothetical protein
MSYEYKGNGKAFLMTLRSSNQQEHPSNDAPTPHQPSANSVAAEPSGPRGDNPATAGPGKTEVKSSTPENAEGHINPSAPEDANTTPGSVGKK